ncbi:MAG TPA: hypothetical protein VN922_13415, partial [Bacteroidia bacterium]|nr:hypothetical protein [Bacteroidia bacterium]
MPKASLLFCSLVLVLLFSSERSSASYVFTGTDTAKAKQNETVPSPTVTSSILDTNHPKMAPTAFVLQPVVGLGVGMFSYFGNVKSVKSYAQNPTTARLGYTLMFGQKINEHFDFDLCALFGTLGQYVRSQNYNWNFQSQIAGGGIHVLYRILPNQDVSPFFTLGLESFNFLSKTDMKDQYGNKYYYWSDGSIRSLPQSASDASTATILTPDYSYETDIRSLNLDGSNKKYSEQTFSIPVGVGFMIHVTKKAEVSFGTTLHYTFTDHIDGLTPDVPGNLRGTTRHDMFLLTSVGLRYDLTRARHLNGEDVDESRYDTVKLDASLIQDTVQPVATDTTPLSDSARARQYRMYKDSTGKYVR